MNNNILCFTLILSKHYSVLESLEKVDYYTQNTIEITLNTILYSIYSV